MQKEEKTIIVIPARKNSSRVKDKNIAPVGGHPLISYTIRMAKALQSVDSVYVDTDSEKYAAISNKYGAEVPFLREPDMATDKASLSATVNRFIDRLCQGKSIQLSRVICMLPTSPFRNLAETQYLVDMLGSYFSVKTVMMANVHMRRSHIQWRDGILPLNKFIKIAGQRYHWMKPLGNFTGSFKNGTAPAHIDVYNGFGYKVISNPMELVDVDTHKDLNLVEKIISESIYDFGMSMS